MSTELPEPHVLAPAAWLLYVLGGLLPGYVLLLGGISFALTYLIPGALLAVLFSRVRGPDGILAIVGASACFSLSSPCLWSRSSSRWRPRTYACARLSSKGPERPPWTLALVRLGGPAYWRLTDRSPASWIYAGAYKPGGKPLSAMATTRAPTSSAAKRRSNATPTPIRATMPLGPGTQVSPTASKAPGTR